MRPELKVSLILTTCISFIGTIAYLYGKKKKCDQKKKKKPKMTLYWFDHFRSKRCEWMFAELGASSDVELIQMNPKEKNQVLVSEYCKFQPHGTVPCLDIEGRSCIIESGAICLYLADIYGNLGPDLDKEAYYNWIIYSVATLDELMEHIFIQWMFTDMKDQDTELIDKNVRKYYTFARYLTKALDGRDYLCGDRLTAADCVLGYNLWWTNEMRDGVLLTDFPVVQEYYERLRRRSAFQRTFMDNLGSS